MPYLFLKLIIGLKLIICNRRDEIQDKVDDEIAWIMYDKGELVSAHIMTEELFNRTKHFSFLTNVLIAATSLAL